MGPTMTIRAPRWLSTSTLVSCLAVLTLTACTEAADPFDRTALTRIRVTVLDASALGEMPFPFAAEFKPVIVSVEALDFDGNRLTDYSGELLLTVVPGEVDAATSRVALEGGVAESHVVRLRYAFGDARLWVEEVGLDRGQECRDGYDNDGDGFIDYPADRGCRSPDDPSESTASYVTGLSDALTFAPITIRNVQYNSGDPTGLSPLVGREVRIEEGTLIVTNVVESGFFVTDVEDTEYNGLFVFNFSFPRGIRVGDKLAWLAGGVAEFQGQTQVTFPDWGHDPHYLLSDEDRQELASCQTMTNPLAFNIEPFLLRSADLRDLRLLEGQESNLVRLENARISTRFVNCDFDLNGDIEGPGEEICRNECQSATRCTELSSFFEFGQFKVDVGGSAAEIAGATQVAGFNPVEGCERVREHPLEYSCPPRTLSSVTGVLRHVYLTRSIQLWVLVPRFHCDLVFRCENDADCLTGGVCNLDNNLCEQEP
jgi:hypothetical protein